MQWCTDELIDSSFAIPVLSHPLSSNGCLLPNASIGIWVDLGTRHWHVNCKCIVEHLSTWFDPGLPMLAPHSCLVTGVLPCQKYVNHYQSIRLKKRPQCSFGDGKLYHVVVAQQVPSHHLCFKSKQNQAWRSNGSSRKCFASKRNPTAIHLSHLNIKSFISLLNSGMFTMACTSTIERRLHHTFTLPKSCAHSRQSKPTESQPYLRKANYVRLRWMLIVFVKLCIHSDFFLRTGILSLPDVSELVVGLLCTSNRRYRPNRTLGAVPERPTQPTHSTHSTKSKLCQHSTFPDAWYDDA